MARKTGERRCALCGDSNSKLNPCGGAYVHEECLDLYRKGRDVSTKQAKAFSTAVLDQSALLPSPNHELPTTAELKGPEDPAISEQAALDASAHRISLLAHLGVDCVAMGVDAAFSSKAENSLEKMLAHQLAAAHKSAMEVTGIAFFEENTGEKARLLSLAARMMDVFQRGLLTFQRLRSGGEQRVTVHHVTVSEGGQAIVGNVRGGDKPK